jgi:colanic acid/amylovoran biosynthesis protein
MGESYQKTSRNIALGAAVEKEFLSELFAPTQKSLIDYNSKRNILIVGGELFNKGAQAMTFTVVDRMKERFPESEIYLLSGRDFERPKKKKSQYAFDILPWGPELSLSLLAPSLDVANTENYSDAMVERVRSLFSENSLLIDVSGYALSSQRGFRASFTYLTNIVLAKRNKIPVYVLPQSIGPFDYPKPQKLVLNPLMRLYLSYPEVICPREQAGFKSLTPYTLQNVQKEFDIVLQNQDYDLNNIYQNKPKLEQKNIDSDSVGIVPNSKVFERSDPKQLYKLYESAIEKLLSKDRTVYVFPHSAEDAGICENIKKIFEHKEEVTLFDNELNAIELERIINQLDFLIASRYHSIIHAYKNSTPVVAIGWAIKYQELLSEFQQSKYFFEGREEIDGAEFVSAVSDMVAEFESESNVIEQKILDIQQKDLFQRLFA